MPQPLTATYRISIAYTVPNLTHLLRTYVQASPSIAAPSGYYLFDRLGLATIDALVAAQHLWTALRHEFANITLAPNAVLENRVGAVWTPVAAGALTGAGTSANAVSYTSQFTLSLRTTDFQRIRIIELDQAQYQAAFKYVGAAALAVGSAALAAAITGSDADGNGYFAWARSKNNKMLHATAPIVSSVYDLNDKVRRARGVQ